MARTYRKFVKRGICTGSNTEYYREKNRKCRAKNRQSLHNMIINYDIETCSDLIPLGEVPIHDSWDEPTDGTILIGRHSRKNFVDDVELIQHRYNPKYHDGTPENYWNRKFGKYLKNKHQKY